MTEDLGFIHRFVPSEDPSGSETLIVLHGTGGDENDLIGIGQAVAPGAAILSPRGNVLEAGAPRFFRRLAEGVFDPKEVRARGEELARFIRAAVVTYRLDATRLFALGFSNGANIASTVMLIEPGILQGAILLRPMLVYEPAERNDLSVDRLVELFESVRAEVTLKWQLAGHNLVPGEVRDAAEWLALRRTRV
jgi:phospholipase/carboxylesterase